MTKSNIISITILIFAFLVVTAEISIAEPPDKGSKAAQIKERIIKNLESKNFQRANQILNQSLLQKSITLNGVRELEEIYQEFKSVDNVISLDEWCNDSEQSHFSYSIRGTINLSAAWKAFVYLLYIPTDLGKKTLFFTSLKNAEQDFRKAFDLNPKDPAAPAAMILVCLLNRAAQTEMEKWYQLAVGIDNFWISAYKNKYIFLSYLRDHSLAFNFSVECYKNSPVGSSVYTILLTYFGDCLPSHRSPTLKTLYALNMHSEAYELVPKCIERYKNDFPDSSWPCYYEGLYNFSQSYFGAAETSFQTALKKHPFNLMAIEQKVNLLIRQQEWETAEKDLNAILTVSPKSPFALTNMGAIKIILHNDSEKGIEFYNQGILHQPSPAIFLNYYLDLAYLLGERNLYTKAIDTLDKAVTIKDNFEKAFFMRGEYKFSSGDIEGALADMGHIVKLNGRYKEIAQSNIETYWDKLNSQNVAQSKDSSTSKDVEVQNNLTNQRPNATENIRSSTPKGSKTYTSQIMTKCEELYYLSKNEEAAKCFSDILSIAPQKEKAKAYFMLGKIAEKIEFNPQKAMSLYHEAVNHDMQNETYILQLGELLYKLNKIDMAVYTLSKLLEKSPKHGRAYYLRGLCFDAKGEIESAIQDMQLAKLYGENNEDVVKYLNNYAQKKIQKNSAVDKKEELRMLAEENMRLNRFDAAEKQYKELISIDPSDHYSHFRLGFLYKSRDRNNQKALEEFNKAISLHPKNADYFYNRAFALKREKKIPAAIEDLTAYLSLKPKDHKVYGRRGDYYMQTGQLVLAENDYKQALKLSPGNKIYTSKLADLSVKLNRAIEVKEENIDSLIELGKSHVKEKEFDEAQKAFLSIIEIKPDHPVPYYLLGKLYSKNLNSPQKAIQYYSMAIDRDQGKRNYYFERGLIFFNKQQYKPALKDFIAASELSPKEGRIYYYRGYCNQQLGLKEEAIKDYLKAKEYDPGWADAVNANLKQML